jgi:hypothetical protein
VLSHGSQFLHLQTTKGLPRPLSLEALKSSLEKPLMVNFLDEALFDKFIKVAKEHFFATETCGDSCHEAQIDLDIEALENNCIEAEYPTKPYHSPLVHNKKNCQQVSGTKDKKEKVEGNLPEVEGTVLRAGRKRRRKSSGTHRTRDNSEDGEKLLQSRHCTKSNVSSKRLKRRSCGPYLTLWETCSDDEQGNAKSKTQRRRRKSLGSLQTRKEINFTSDEETESDQSRTRRRRKSSGSHQTRREISSIDAKDSSKPSHLPFPPIPNCEQIPSISISDDEGNLPEVEVIDVVNYDGKNTRRRRSSWKRRRTSSGTHRTRDKSDDKEECIQSRRCTYSKVSSKGEKEEDRVGHISPRGRPAVTRKKAMPNPRLKGKEENLQLLVRPEKRSIVALKKQTVISPGYKGEEHL